MTSILDALNRPATLWCFSWSVAKIAQEIASIIKLIQHKRDACLRTSAPDPCQSQDPDDAEIRSPEIYLAMCEAVHSGIPRSR